MAVTISNSPVHSDAIISYPYGVTDSGYKCGWHTGVDIVPTGDTENNPWLYPVFDGEIVTINTNASNRLGIYILIKDTQNRYWRYCHLMTGTVQVVVGQQVTTGTALARMDSTGNVTGRHLHLECATTSAWQCSTFLNPCTILGIPNERGTIVKYDGSSPFPTASWIYKDEYLNETEKENNAICVINYYRNLGINDKTIAGILGNMEAESTIEPILNERGRRRSDMV